MLRQTRWHAVGQQVDELAHHVSGLQDRMDHLEREHHSRFVLLESRLAVLERSQGRDPSTRRPQQDSVAGASGPALALGSMGGMDRAKDLLSPSPPGTSEYARSLVSEPTRVRMLSDGPMPGHSRDTAAWARPWHADDMDVGSRSGKPAGSAPPPHEPPQRSAWPASGWARSSADLRNGRAADHGHNGNEAMQSDEAEEEEEEDLNYMSPFVLLSHSEHSGQSREPEYATGLSDWTESERSAGGTVASSRMQPTELVGLKCLGAPWLCWTVLRRGMCAWSHPFLFPLLRLGRTHV